MAQITVLGAGAWGTALALQAYTAGNEVTLWAYLENEKKQIGLYRENKTRLPGVAIPSEIQVTCNLEQAVLPADILLVVTPAQAIRGFLKTLKPYLISGPGKTVVFCSKGMEIETGALLSEICQEVIPDIAISFLSGPNFAHEIGAGKPGAATIASLDLKKSIFLAETLSSKTFRLYASEDPLGVQIGGALKNVVAIGAGMVTGAKLGENARAALIARGLQEMVRYGDFKGAKRETFMGLSGVGDLVLCCMSMTSRNMKFGFEIGQGAHVDKVKQETRVLTEGAYTVKAILSQMQKASLEMPICQAVYRILYEGKTVESEMGQLLTRPLKLEVGTNVPFPI